MGSLSRKLISVVALAMSTTALASAARACDFNSIDPACGYISQNPANINSINNPSNPNNPNNPANPNSPLNINNTNNPASLNNPYSGINISNPYSPYNQTHPESIYSALNPANVNNPNNPANPSYQAAHRMSDDEVTRTRGSVQFSNGIFGLFEGDHPAVLYRRDGIERECRLNLDCPRSVYVESGMAVPEQIRGDAENAPAIVPSRKGRRHRRSDG